MFFNVFALKSDQNYFQCFHTKMFTATFFNVFTVPRLAAAARGQAVAILAKFQKVKKNWKMF